jgi:hypothetical protein
MSPLFISVERRVWNVDLAWILSLDSNRKDLNCWSKVTIISCETGLHRLTGLVSLGRRCGRYKGYHIVKIMLRHSTMLVHDSDALFILFGREMRH